VRRKGSYREEKVHIKRMRGSYREEKVHIKRMRGSYLMTLITYE